MKHLLSLVALVTVALVPLTAQNGIDLAIINGVVYTVDSARPAAEALAIAADRIVAVGTTADIKKLAGPRARVIDARGGFVTPGFNDAHVHIDSTGALLVGVNLLDVHEPNAFRQRIADAAKRLPKGSWITRGEWGAYEQWSSGSSGSAGSRGSGGSSGSGRSSPGPGPFTPSRDMIDAVTPDHPVLVNRFDRSMFLANTRALEMAGITASTPNPPGGEILKDASGRPTGILTGAAADLVRKVQAPISFEQRLVQVRAVLREAREGGITTMQDLTSADQLMAYQALQRAGELTARISIRPQLWEVEHVKALGVSRGFGDDWLRLVGYKAWVDGIMGNSSALFFEPYDHNPNSRGWTRHIMHPEPVEGAALQMNEQDHYTRFPPGNMEKLITEAVKTGVPPHVHAIGDQGVRILLDIYERVLTEQNLVDKDHRWRMIHAQVVHPDDFPRFGKLRLVAEVNPYHVSDDMRWMEERIGKERSQGAYAFRKLKDSGATLIFGSDSPGTNAARYFLSPIYGLYAAVTRQTLTGEPKEGWFPDQRLSIEEAIDAYTRGPAWATFEEHLKGTLTPGKLADVAVFDTNLVEAAKKNPAQLLKAKVNVTVVGGKVVYERGAAPTSTP
jgi:predicted amidohydrolase YtcJ